MTNTDTTPTKVTTAHVTLTLPVPLDKCDAATFHGIVRRALEESQELKTFTEFRDADQVVIVSRSDDDGDEPYETVERLH